MARDSSSTPTRMVFLLHGEDPFRTRLRLVELVHALLEGRATDAGDLAAQPETGLGAALGVTRHDARTDSSAVIALAGQSQSLFAAPDERRVVVVEHAEALVDLAFIAALPREAALVLVAIERLAPTRARRAPARARAVTASPASLLEAVEAAGGRIERIERLLPPEVPRWIEGRAKLHSVRLAPESLAALAGAVGPDTDRIEQELGKLAAYTAGQIVSAADVRALVSGAIEADVFELTQAVVRRDVNTAMRVLDRLLDEGHAVQQILALLLWQFRVLLFASASRSEADTLRMAKAIRTTPGAIARASAFARRVSRADVTRAYEALYATDQVIKTGRAESDSAALMLCVLDLCGVAGADLRDMLLVEPPRRV